LTQPQDRAGRVISLAEITDDNWRAVADVAEQGKGVGRAALDATIRLLRGRLDAREVRLSYHPDNKAAARLYAEAGFRPTGDTEDDEIVVALRP